MVGNPLSFFVKTLHLTINMRVPIVHHIQMICLKNLFWMLEMECPLLNFLKKFAWTQWRWTSTVNTFNEQDESYFGRAILTTTNEHVDKINKLVMDRLPDLPENTRTYWSADSVVMKNNKAYTQLIFSTH